LRDVLSNGVQRIELKNLCGQRYIGTDLDKPVAIAVKAEVDVVNYHLSGVIDLEKLENFRDYRQTGGRTC